MASIHIRDLVRLSQTLVDERIVGIQEAHQAAIFANDTLEEKLRFLLERFTQAVIEIRKGFRIRLDRPQIPQQEPLAGEIAHQGVRSDRKSTRLNSSHQIISYPVFCFKKTNFHRY